MKGKGMAEGRINLGELEKQIAKLESQFQRFRLSSGAEAFSAGDCTNGCTDACTRGCTNGCTGSCLTSELIREEQQAGG
jgi:hypothetical protein